jgi:hypothetical protein
VTGKLAKLPMEKQREIWTRIETDMKATIDRLTKQGKNPLEAGRQDLKAKTLSRQILKQPPAGSSPSPFTEPAYIEEVEVRVESHAPTAARLWDQVAEKAGEMGREKDRWRAKTINAATAAFEVYWAEKSKGLSDAQKLYREALNSTMENLLFRSLHDLSPGMPVRFEDGVLGVVTDVRRKPDQNPYAPSS